jgi:hypothetical protein
MVLIRSFERLIPPFLLSSPSGLAKLAIGLVIDLNDILREIPHKEG